MSHKKFGPDRFSRFDVYWIQTNKQTDKSNLYIDVRLCILTLDVCFFVSRKRRYSVVIQKYLVRPISFAKLILEVLLDLSAL